MERKLCSRCFLYHRLCGMANKMFISFLCCNLEEFEKGIKKLYLSNRLAHSLIWSFIVVVAVFGGWI